ARVAHEHHDVVAGAVPTGRAQGIARRRPGQVAVPYVEVVRVVPEALAVRVDRHERLATSVTSSDVTAVSGGLLVAGSAGLRGNRFRGSWRLCLVGGVAHLGGGFRGLRPCGPLPAQIDGFAVPAGPSGAGGLV